jgi:RHS repeat-associated protein
MTVTGQPPVSYGYDNADRLTSLTQDSATISLAYDDANRRTGLTLSNGVTVEYGYDAASQMTGITFKLGPTTVLGNLTYTYDLAGNRTSVGGTWARTGLPAALASATYDAANQVATWGSTSFTYDANGNLSSDGTKTYVWNARDQLVGLTGTTSANFAYDGFGRRRGMSVAGTDLTFLYDGFNTVQELAAGIPSANVLPGLGIDEWFTLTDGAGPRFFLSDALGSTVALVDGAGLVQTQYTYEPFGRAVASGAPSANRFQFSGREADDAGLFHYRARYYNPNLQRFLSDDPLGFASGDMSLYTYVRNTPLMGTDPFGLEFVIGGRFFRAQIEQWRAPNQRFNEGGRIPTESKPFVPREVSRIPNQHTGDEPTVGDLYEPGSRPQSLAERAFRAAVKPPGPPQLRGDPPIPYPGGDIGPWPGAPGIPGFVGPNGPTKGRKPACADVPEEYWAYVPCLV